MPEYYNCLTTLLPQTRDLKNLFQELRKRHNVESMWTLKNQIETLFPEYVITKNNKIIHKPEFVSKFWDVLIAKENSIVY